MLAVLALCLLFGSVGSASAGEVEIDPVEMLDVTPDPQGELPVGPPAAITPTGAIAAAEIAAAPSAQVPNVRPFRSAHFDLAGTVKLEGITVVVLGDGDLAPLDRQRSSFKFGPFTVEIVMVGDQIYTLS